MTSDRCVACAGFCALPAIIILVIVITCQLLSLQSDRMIYSGEKNSFVISWITTDVANSTVRLGLSPEDLKEVVQGDVVRFRETSRRTQYVHVVKLNGLKPNIYYFYSAGSEEGGWSNVFWFHTLPDDAADSFSPTFAFFGDFGSTNSVSLPELQKETHERTLDLVVHAGDMAYDLDDEEGKIGDDFLRRIEPVAAYIPYMTSPGNHEHPNDYLEYRNRFLMPLPESGRLDGDGGGLHYSFDFGPVHFISLNVEVYYKNGGTIKNVSREQYFKN